MPEAEAQLQVFHQNQALVEVEADWCVALPLMEPVYQQEQQPAEDHKLPVVLRKEVVMERGVPADTDMVAVAQMAELGAAGSTWVEKHVIYGGLNVVGYGNHLLAKQWRQLQSGMVHHYAAIIVAGLFLLAVVIQLIVQR